MAKLLAFAAVALTAAASDFTEVNGVLELDDASFDAALTTYDPLLVAFVAPWCGHCQKLKPEYAKAAKALKTDNIHLAQVDATQSKELAERYGVSGFPTIKFFRGGQASEYNGGRDEASIVSWMRKRAGPAATRVASVDAAAAAVASNEVTVIAFASEGSEAEAALFTTASGIEDVAFLITDAAGVRERFAAADDATAVIIATFDGETEKSYFTQPLGDADAFKAWVAAHSLPEVVTFSQEAAPRIFRGEQKKHFLLFTDRRAAGAQADAFAAFRAAAGEGRAHALFVYVPPSEDKVMSYFGITAESFPAAVLVHMSSDAGMKKFMFSGEFSSDALRAFLADVNSGAVRPFLKSEPAPDADLNRAAAVKVVTGNTFEQLVLDAEKDVLLEVYAPWCGHCKQLEPVYAKLGEALRGKPHIVVAKMDGTANEIDFPGVNVRGFPSIYFFPAGENKRALEYDGGRDLEGFLAYLSKQSSQPFSVDDFDIDDEYDA